MQSEVRSGQYTWLTLPFGALLRVSRRVLSGPVLIVVGPGTLSIDNEDHGEGSGSTSAKY